MNLCSRTTRLAAFALGVSLISGGVDVSASPAQAAVGGFEGVTTENVGGQDDGKYEAPPITIAGQGILVCKSTISTPTNSSV